MNIKKIKIREYGVIIGFVFLCIVISILEPKFFTGKNILNLLRQSSIVGIISVGMTCVIISGNFDVSVGAIAALSGVVVMKLLSMYVPLPIAIILCIIIGMIIGIVNGVAVAKFAVPSLIATMAATIILNGIILLVTGGYPISGKYEAFDIIGNGYIGIIPIPIIIFVLTIIIIYILLQYTKTGRYIYSVGGNEEASNLSGINSDMIKIKVFVISGMLSSIAGIVLTSRLNTATATAGTGYDMDSIASVVIGGTSVLGGEGSVLKTIIGVLFMSVINNAFNLLGVDTYFQFIVKGSIILIAVGLDSYNRKKRVKD